MAKRKKLEIPQKEPVRRLRPALTPEARESQLVSAAYDLVEERILNGTATSQETVFFLKMGSPRARLEREKLRKENELLEAKAESIKSMQRVEELYSKALQSMREYSGNFESEEGPYENL